MLLFCLYIYISFTHIQVSFTHIYIGILFTSINNTEFLPAKPPFRADRGLHMFADIYMCIWKSYRLLRRLPNGWWRRGWPRWCPRNCADPYEDTLSSTVIYIILLIHMCDMTYSYVWHDSFMRVTWLIFTCDMTYSCVTRLIHTCNLTRLYVRHGLFICVA